MSWHKNESSWTFILFYTVCNLSLNWPLWEDRSLQHTEENCSGWDSCQVSLWSSILHKCGEKPDTSVFLILWLCADMLLGCTELMYEHTDALSLMLKITFNSAFKGKYVDDDDDNHVVLRQVHSLFQREFSTQCDLVLPLSNCRIFSFP